MKKYLFTLLLILSSIQAQASVAFSSKLAMIKQATTHREKALELFHKADSIYNLIPDLSKRDHMHALIVAATSTIGISDTRAKFLAVGLGLIASLSTETYDNFLRWRHLIYTASYHLEMANFYAALSIQLSDSKRFDNGTLAILHAIDSLTLSEVLANCIEDRDDKLRISKIIVNQRTSLIKKFEKLLENTPDVAGIAANMYEDAYAFSEKIEEITEDLEDEDIQNNMCMHVYAYAEDVELACRYWFGDLKSQNVR